MRTESKQVGFTLIELIIVIVIIGLLAAIALPIYVQYIGKAQLSSCLAEAKSYSNHIFYTLNDENNNTLPIVPDIGACQFITNASGWTLDTQQKIIAVAKSPSNARIECDIPNGSPCRVLP